MAEVYIERIVHSSTQIGKVTLLQNDPSKRPNINGREYKKDEPIIVNPGAKLNATWFVIPWPDYGRVNVAYGDGSVNYDIGPSQSDPHNDYLRARNGRTGQLISEEYIGPRGNSAKCKILLELLVVDSLSAQPGTAGVEFQFYNSSGTSTISAETKQKIKAGLQKLAQAVAKVIKAVAGAA